MRQARATLTYGSPILCDGVVNSGVEAARQGEMGADFTLLIPPSWAHTDEIQATSFRVNAQKQDRSRSIVN